MPLHFSTQVLPLFLRQVKTSLIADGYPTPENLKKLLTKYEPGIEAKKGQKWTRFRYETIDYFLVCLRVNGGMREMGLEFGRRDGALTFTIRFRY